jgi:glucose-6-phosphate isomerase
MSIKLDNQYLGKNITPSDLADMQSRVTVARDLVLHGGGAGAEFLGWVNLPRDYDQAEYARVKDAARRIREMADVLVVIGIGGSYLGARAVIELLQNPSDKMKIIFAGKSLSAVEMHRILGELEGQNWVINVISKSGTTTEPAVAFRILRQKLTEKYGAEEAAQRIFATTDSANGTLRALADAEGCETFTIPDDIGGRFSVLSSVGLLPIAAAGIDTDELLAGAQSAHGEQSGDGSDALQYAAIRNILYEKNYGVEVLSAFEPSFAAMNEWWKQLFGESEGKSGQGILPDSMIFTTDLHSLGQYVQDGKKQLFEADTVIYAIGQKPLWEEADGLHACAPEFYQIGDCLAPKNIRAATKSAYFIATGIGRF